MNHRLVSLADGLEAAYGLGEEWRAALTAAPRHLFVPETGLACPDTAHGTPYPIDRQARPGQWMDAAYADASIVSQRDDGRGDPADADGGMPTSSISAPGVVLRFLQLLEPGDGMRVLDVGTATGWTAALLSARLGAGNVTSVEIDPQVAKQGAANLEAAGFTPELIVGDAAQLPEGLGLFDRVNVTCGVRQIPYSWVEHTRPGGVIVAPWQPDGYSGHVVRLVVRADGSAVGSFHGRASYMPLRGQRTAVVWNPHHSDQAEITRTTLDPMEVAEAGDGARLAITAAVPGLCTQSKSDGAGAYSWLLFELGKPDGSWAGCYRQPGDSEFEIYQYGDRRLWDEAAAAYRTWVSARRPGEDRYRLQVTASQERILLT